MAFGSSLLFSLHGAGISNVPAFLTYIVLVSAFVAGGNLRRLKLGRLSGVALSFFALASLSVLFQNSIYGSLVDNNGVDAFEFAVNNLIVNFAYFVFGWLAVLPREKDLGLYVYIPLGMLAFLFAPFGGGVLDYQAISDALGRDVNHLVVAPNALALIFIAVAYSAGWARFSVYVLGAVLLFVVGSRTALFFGLLVAMLVPVLVGKARTGFFVLFGFFVFVCGVYFFRDAFDQDVAERMFFGEGVSDDLSSASRLIQFQIGFEALLDQILIGDMNFVVRYFGGVGFYMHNVLSFWQEYGFFVFSIVCVLLVFLIDEILRDLRFLKVSRFGVIEYRVYLGAYVVVASLLSMSYTFKMLWFAIGMYCIDFRSKRV